MGVVGTEGRGLMLETYKAPVKAHDSRLHEVPGGPDNVSGVGGATPREHGEHGHPGCLDEWPVSEVHQ